MRHRTRSRRQHRRRLPPQRWRLLLRRAPNLIIARGTLRSRRRRLTSATSASGTRAGWTVRASTLTLTLTLTLTRAVAV
jgi:hypothetical protein